MRETVGHRLIRRTVVQGFTGNRANILWNSRRGFGLPQYVPFYAGDTIKALNFEIHKDYTPDYLGEFDYSQQSGWMYSINGAFEMRPREGQTLRWQFSIVGLWRDLGGDKE